MPVLDLVNFHVHFLSPQTIWNSLPDHLRDPAVDSKQYRLDLICSPDIRSVSALEVLSYRALQIDISLLTH